MESFFVVVGGSLLGVVTVVAVSYSLISYVVVLSGSVGAVVIGRVVSSVVVVGGSGVDVVVIVIGSDVVVSLVVVVGGSV